MAFAALDLEVKKYGLKNSEGTSCCESVFKVIRKISLPISVRNRFKAHYRAGCYWEHFLFTI